LPVDFLVTGGQVNDCTQAIELLGERKTDWVLADKGYDSQAILDHIEAMGAVAVVPSKSNRKQQRTHDKVLYRQRNRIERCFSRLNSNRTSKLSSRSHARGCTCSYMSILPGASSEMTATEKPGDLRIWRSANRMSAAIDSMAGYCHASRLRYSMSVTLPNARRAACSAFVRDRFSVRINCSVFSSMC
jgi:transposase